MTDPSGAEPGAVFNPPDADPPGGQGALRRERSLPPSGGQREVEQVHRCGLEAAESIVDRPISTFSRGELPHFTGFNTFLKAPNLEDVTRVGDHDVAVVDVSHDSGTTCGPGTRFGPQGIRRISALCTPCNDKMGVDLGERIRLCHVGDIFTIPPPNEKGFDQISSGVAPVFASRVFPVILGGDHPIGFPTVRGVCRHLGEHRVGIIHLDRHVDTQETDLDERMQTCPWSHGTNMATAGTTPLPSVNPSPPTLPSAPAEAMHMPLEDTLGLDLLAANRHRAGHNRDHFDAWNLLCLNVMSSPGAGKTALLERTLAHLAPRWRMAVLEGDMTTQLDALRIEALGIPVVPITTGRACHLDAAMVSGGLELLRRQLDPAGLDLLWVENVGNLVCPAEFEVGEHHKVALLSVTEGEDKPLKYPVMFREADCVLITKVDLLPHLPVDAGTIEAHVREVNPSAAVFRLSALTGQGFGAWYAWLAARVEELRGSTPPQVGSSLAEVP